MKTFEIILIFSGVIIAMVMLYRFLQKPYKEWRNQRNKSYEDYKKRKESYQDYVGRKIPNSNVVVRDFSGNIRHKPVWEGDEGDEGDDDFEVVSKPSKRIYDDILTDYQPSQNRGKKKGDNNEDENIWYSNLSNNNSNDMIPTMFGAAYLFNMNDNEDKNHNDTPVESSSNDYSSGIGSSSWSDSSSSNSDCGSCGSSD